MSDTDRCFVDTNVWLYALIASQDARKSAEAAALLQRTSLAISVQVINEVCVNLLRKSALQEQEVRELIESFFAKCRVVPYDQLVLTLASDLRGRYSLSFWDSLIVSAAVNGGCKVLYTEDMQHGLVIDNTLRVANPFLPT